MEKNTALVEQTCYLLQFLGITLYFLLYWFWKYLNRILNRKWFSKTASHIYIQNLTVTDRNQSVGKNVNFRISLETHCFSLFLMYIVKYTYSKISILWNMPYIVKTSSQ